MRMISIDQVEPGTLIVEPIMNKGGRLLVNKGTALSPTLIAKLRDLDILEVPVEGDAADEMNEVIQEEAAYDAKLSPELLKRITDRFENVRDNPHMRIIEIKSKKYLVQQSAD